MNLPERTIRRAQQIVTEGLPIGPRMHPCVCRAGRHAHSGKEHTGGCKATGCRRYRTDTAYELAYKALDAQATKFGHSLRQADDLEREQHYKQRPRVDGEWSIGASDTGTCPKKIEYRNSPPDDLIRAPEDKREARAGTMLHDQITARMKRLYPWREYGGLVRIPGLDRDSEFDSYDPVTGEVEDYKTAGDWKWDQIGDHGPDETTWEQVMLYGLAIEATGRVVRTVRLSYYKRANGHDESFVRDYDPVMAKAALDRLLGYATALDLGHPLPKTGTGPTSDIMCKRCFARIHCWNMDVAEAVGRSPESVTILGVSPEDEDIAWAVAEKVEAAAARLAAKKREDNTKELLIGVEPGRYGDYEGYSRGGNNGPNWEEYAARLVEFYDLPEEQRPAVEDIPPPADRRYTYIAWGRVRKATLEREKRERAALDRGDETG